jgi:hypothetical protein
MTITEKEGQLERGKATSTIKGGEQQASQEPKEDYGATWNDNSTWHKSSTGLQEPLDATTPSTTTS